MENRGLVFMPDISGFTRFINETELDHSRLIIQELLELLINANQIGLQVSEIEGDAILFYKYGEAPDLSALYQQVEVMFCAFHRHLLAYDQRKFCQCRACTSAVNLTLKIITHYGEFTSYQVKNFHKLIGKDIIVAHQLLKNDIEPHEYWLITQNLLPDSGPADFTQWMEWKRSAKRTEGGEIPFHYTPLSHLKEVLQPEPFLQPELAGKVKMLSLAQDYDADILPLFHAVGDYHYRSRWQEGVKAVEEVSHFLPRVGMRCRCVLENGQVNIYTSSYRYQPHRIEFTETDEQGKSLTYFLLEKTEKNKTRLTVDFYRKKDLISGLLFRWKRKKKMEETWQKSFRNLAALVKEIEVTLKEES
jgi:hypothetical protein